MTTAVVKNLHALKSEEHLEYAMTPLGSTIADPGLSMKIHLVMFQKNSTV
jgi:hypothetical protein